IGSVRRGTATNLAFTQIGDQFLLNDPPLDVNVTNLGTSATLFELTVPSGLKVEALYNAYISQSNDFVYISSPDVLDEPPAADGGAAGPLQTVAAPNVTAIRGTGGNLRTFTNTSSQIRARADAASSFLDIATLGWIDRRGRDD
ncbi:hypothetical protein LCGC14_3144170, partial [marine sediment metagenome]